MESKKAVVELVFIKAAGATNLAKMLELPRRRVQHWKDKGHIPIKYIARVSAVTGVHREALAPELYE